MSYTALYRKFRPLTFSEIVGQEHITKTIKNQIIVNRVGHAYLFNGSRGTGKTSAAKILARAINCLDPKGGEPCNKCEICKAAISGSLTDIVEMDAASNNSVEDIRSIREEVNFLPTLAKYRVYIIDEVHMLSTGAFNALLKTLEEPPEHVKFILATTEPQKLPATILSRCQRFDFKKIPNKDIEKRLKYICDESKLDITEGAIKLIAVLSEGAMRDALSILERCIQEGQDTINEEKIKDLVGIPKLETIYKIVKSIFEYNVKDALNSACEIIESGKDLNNLLWEIIKYIKDILVYKVNAKLEIYSENEILQIKELSEIINKERLLSIIYELSEVENDMKWSSQKNILFQVAIIKLCYKENKVNNVDNVEESTPKRKLIENKDTKNLKSQEDINTNIITMPIDEKKNKETEKDTNKIKSMPNWEKVVVNLKQSGKILLYTNLINSNAVELNDMTVGISFPNGLTPFGKSILEKTENINELSKLVSMEYGKEMKIKIIDEKKNKEKGLKENQFENVLNDMDIPFNIIDE